MDTKIGVVISYNREKRYGFLIYNDVNYFFFNDSKKRSVRHFYRGDEVEFQFEQIDDSLQAINVKFIKNSFIDKMIEEYENKGFLIGFLNIINDKYFVVHKTKVAIPIEISEWETDLDNTYTNRVNQLVKFRLHKGGDITRRFRATIIDRKFTSEYSKLINMYISQESMDVKIDSRGNNNFGYCVKIFDNISGYITDNISIGEIENDSIVSVKISQVCENKFVNLKIEN